MGAAAPTLAAPTVVQLGGHVEKASGGGAMVRAIVKIAKGFHINAHEPDEPFLIPTVLELRSEEITFDEPNYPEPLSLTFPFSPDKPMLVYEGTIEIVAHASNVPTGPVYAKLRYQACDDERCLAPASAQAILGERSPDAAAALEGVRPAASTGTGGEGSWLLEWLRGASLLSALGMTLVLGLGLNLTPCVYPLLSVTLGFFGQQAGGGRRPWRLAIAYVVGITLSFAALGVSASLAGGLFGAPLQQPAVLIGLAILLVALALSSFGFYEIRAPTALMQRFGGSSSGLGGALTMGLTMGIVAAPCIGPVVLGLLVYVGSERDALKGFALFSSMGLGMGFPYIFLATAAGSIDRLPRSGEWLAWMNRLFGVVLLAMAAYFVAPLLGSGFLLAFPPLFLAAAALYLGFLEPSGKGMPGFYRARRIGGVLVLGFALWLGASNAMLGPSVRWEPLTTGSLDQALRAQRPAVVEFSAQWCLPCVEMENSTFVDPEVVRSTEGISMLKADVTASSDANERLLEQFGVLGVPTIIFYDAEGREIDRLVGFVGADDFISHLQQARATPGRVAEGST